MKLVEQSFSFLDKINRETLLNKIELAGRVCYKSENKITDGSASRFVSNLVKSGHLSVIEHVSVTCKFITNRAITHELVRHRLASYSQESTRYVNYAKLGELTFIKPKIIEDRGIYKIWYEAMEDCENAYISLLHHGIKPEDARGVLPNDLKTEIVMTANLREWLHIFSVRCSKKAHPQIRELLTPVFMKFNEYLPEVFSMSLLFDKVDDSPTK